MIGKRKKRKKRKRKGGELVKVDASVVEEGLDGFPNGTRADEFSGSFDIRVHEAVLVPRGHLAADEFVQLLKRFSRTERTQKVDGLAGGQKLDGEDGLDVGDDFETLSSGPTTHGDVVFFSSRGRDRVR